MTTPKLREHRSVLAGTSRLDCYSPPLGGGKRPRRKIMRRLNPLIVILAAIVVPLGALLMAAPALASTSGTIYKECEQNGQVTGHFTAAQLKAALNGLPSEVSEYSDCQDLIQQALVRVSSTGGGSHTGSGKGHASGAKGGGGGPGKGSGQTGKTGSSTAKNGRSARNGGGNAATLAGSGIRSGSTESSGSSSSLPVALIVVLILLALTAVSGGVVAIRRRVDARHGT
jgi:cobalamin biosynthesis Mg chelatase CobN